MFYPQSVIIYQWRSVIFHQPIRSKGLRPSPAWWPTVCRSESSAVPGSNLWFHRFWKHLKIGGGSSKPMSFCLSWWMKLETLQFWAHLSPETVQKKTGASPSCVSLCETAQKTGLACCCFNSVISRLNSSFSTFKASLSRRPKKDLKPIGTRNIQLLNGGRTQKFCVEKLISWLN